MKEAGEQLGVSKERVRQVHNDALAVLRLPVYSVGLRQLCEQDSRDAYLHSRQLSRQWLRKGGDEMSTSPRFPPDFPEKVLQPIFDTNLRS